MLLREGITLKDKYGLQEEKLRRYKRRAEALKKLDEMRSSTSKFWSILHSEYDHGKSPHCLRVLAIHAAMQKKSIQDKSRDIKVETDSRGAYGKTNCTK